jgi:hypothetical protein
VSDESLTVCVSEVRRALGDKDQQIVKTVPKRGYMVDVAITKSGSPTVQISEAAKPTEVADLPLSTLSLPNRPSIAVLPFTNMAGDPQQEHIADGIVEDITTELSRFRELFVRSGSTNSDGRMSGNSA